jgi:hypothetical protein
LPHFPEGQLRRLISSMAGSLIGLLERRSMEIEGTGALFGPAGHAARSTETTPAPFISIPLFDFSAHESGWSAVKNDLAFRGLAPMRL